MSAGSKISIDADFWGWTLVYTRTLASGRIFSASLAWDEETEIRRNTADKVVQTYTSTFAWTYPVTARWSVSAGIGKGIITCCKTRRKVHAQGPFRMCACIITVVKWPM